MEARRGRPECQRFQLLAYEFWLVVTVFQDDVGEKLMFYNRVELFACKPGSLFLGPVKLEGKRMRLCGEDCKPSRYFRHIDDLTISVIFSMISSGRASRSNMATDYSDIQERRRRGTQGK